MADYTQAIDAHISQTLSLRGYVTPEMMAGLDREEAAEALARYVQIHSSEVPLSFDGERMTWVESPHQAGVAGPMPPGTPPQSPGAPPFTEPGRARAGVSPVDQVMQAPAGKSLLDVEPSGGRYSKWVWWLPFMLGIVGGIIGWLIVRDANRAAARQMLIAGVVVTVVSGAMSVGMLSGMRGGSTSSAWPPSTSGQVTFYYFGTST